MKKDIKGKNIKIEWIVIIVLAVIVLIAGGTILAMRLMGYRYQTTEYISIFDEENSTVTFFGITDKDGQMKSGTLYYENKKAEVSRAENGEYRLEYSNGDVYTGAMSGFQRQGTGKMVYSNGCVYEGEFSADKMHGKGRFTYANGDFYEGSFSAGKKSGEGKYIWMEDGKVIASYEGCFKNDRRNGYGVFTSSDGTIYKGNFVNDVRQDEQAEAYIINDQGGVDRYYGSYDGDIISGYGYYFYEGGNVYVGEFANNRPHGKGTIYLANGESFSGIFANGEIAKSDTSLLPKEEEESFFEHIESLEENLKKNK